MEQSSEPASDKAPEPEAEESNKRFTGNVFIFYSFDIGDDIDLEKIKELELLVKRPLQLPKYFKGYHTPLSVDLPHPHSSLRCISAKIHEFGVLSLVYKIPFTRSFEELRGHINDIEEEYRQQSVKDASALYKQIKEAIKQPRFFHIRRSYMLIQVDSGTAKVPIAELKKNYGGLIASTLRFERESLSEFQKNEILDSTIGYYRGDLIIIDTDATFFYDTEYEDILDIFEFANLQALELQYFDRLLDQQLNAVYEQREVKRLPLISYLPFIGVLTPNPIEDLGKLKVDISVITERIESSIKLAGEVYYLEIYDLLVEKLDLENWKESINRKLEIIKDVRTVYENRMGALREDLISLLIIVLIFMEMLVGIFHYFK